MSASAITAIAERLVRLLRSNEHDFTLNDIRALFREELRDMDFAPREQALFFTPPGEMTDDEKKVNDRNVLAAPYMF